MPGSIRAPERADAHFGYRGELTISGLINLRARNYDPSAGVFTSVDPIDGRPGQTTVANSYAYVGNDPLNYTDPLGLCRIDDVGFQMSVSAPDAEARVIGGGASALTLEQCESTPTVTCENLGTGSDSSAPAGDFYSYTTTYSCGPEGVNRNPCLPMISDDPNCNSALSNLPIPGDSCGRWDTNCELWTEEGCRLASGLSPLSAFGALATGASEGPAWYLKTMTGKTGPVILSRISSGLLVVGASAGVVHVTCVIRGVEY